MEKQKTNDRTKKVTGGYSNITIKKETAIRFRSYSKRFNKSHSKVLDGMIQYFKENNLDPFGEGTKIVLDSIKKLERQMMKKFDRLIAIIKNMEKTSIRPTYEMVLILYEAYVKDGKKPRPEPVKIQEERMDFWSLETPFRKQSTREYSVNLKAIKSVAMKSLTALKR